MLTLKQLALYLNQDIDSDALIEGVAFDSRKVKAGDLFVALKSDVRDGHDFVEHAIANGASALLISKPVSNGFVPFLMVEDTLQALAITATEHRKRLPVKVVALTGSNGKTSVKEMIACMLPKPAYATRGNLNNHIGAPISLLELTPEHRYAVIELGASVPGDIAYTAAMAQPDVSLVNNIAPAHIGGFGTIDEIARTKGMIYEALKPGQIAVVNDDDDYAHFWDRALKDKEVIRFSKTHPTDLYADNISSDKDGFTTFTMHYQGQSANVKLLVPGLHQVSNALAAAGCALGLSLSFDEIVRGLESFSGVGGRLNVKKAPSGAIVIDDTYNANLASMMAGIDVLASRTGRRILMVGDMGELGEYAKDHHAKIGEAARLKGIDELWAVGEWSKTVAEAFGVSARAFLTMDEMQKRLSDLNSDAHTSILVKGSRSAAMERVVMALLTSQ